MDRIFLVGEFNYQIKRSFKVFFERLGITVSFSKEKPGSAAINFFKSYLTHFQAGNRSLYGVAFPETKTVLIKFPCSMPINMACEDRQGLINSNRLFLLVALHEYLHIKGLKHCNVPRCLMAKTKCDANKEESYCLSCLSLTKKAIPLCKKCRAKAGKFILL